MTDHVSLSGVKGVVHIAAAPEPPIQRCSRCGRTILDNTGAVSSDGMFGHWAVGEPVTVFARYSEAGNHGVDWCEKADAA